MLDMLQDLILTFIPLFVAFDTIGLVPIFISLTRGMDAQSRGRILRHSVITATAVTLVSPTVGVVPIGTPIIAGPAVLTTLIMLNDIYGFSATVLSLMVNLAIIWFVFSRADVVLKFLGEGGSRATSKVVSLLLAAIAVMMIRKGIEG